MNFIKNKYVTIASAILFFLCLNACKTQKKTETELPVIQKIDNDGFTTIFNGINLKGWVGDTTYWHVLKNGVLEGKVTEHTRLKRNSFIIYTEEQPEDFELKLDYKISQLGNSGVNYRSEIIEGVPFALRGYQSDIDGKKRYVGQNYEEKKRTTLAYVGERVTVPPMPAHISKNNLRKNIEKNRWKSREVAKLTEHIAELKQQVNDTSWNTMHLVVKSNRMLHYINGVLMSDVTDMDTINRRTKGYIGVQVHTGPPMVVKYKNIKLKKE